MSRELTDFSELIDEQFEIEEIEVEEDAIAYFLSFFD